MLSVKEISEQILSYSPCDVIKLRILTEYFHADANSDEIINIRMRANQSKWVKSIKNEQLNDGSWGRFHTRNSKEKRKYPTTESVLLYLNALGLKRGDEVIDKACNYMENLLNDLSLWPDAWEGNKWFKPAVPLYIASKLAMFGSDNQKYLDVCLTWLSILQYSFSDGDYNCNKCDEKAKEILGVNIHNQYIGLNGYNNIILFAHIKDKIPKVLQKQYLHWLHTFPQKLAYTNTRLDQTPESINRIKELQSWIIVMNVLSKFDYFYDEFSKEIEWLISVA